LGHSKFDEYRSRVRLLHTEQAIIRPKKHPDNWWRHWWFNYSQSDISRETDIFLVFEIVDSGKRFALLIGNKKGNGRFKPGQAEAYKPRGASRLNDRSYLNYSDFETVLIAPTSVRLREREKLNLFGRYIAFEDIAAFVPEFGF
jgi:hypothetical protein